MELEDRLEQDDHSRCSDAAWVGAAVLEAKQLYASFDAAPITFSFKAR